MEREFFVFEQKSVKSTSLLNTLIITAKQFHEIFFGEREFLVFEQKFREINVLTIAINTIITVNQFHEIFFGEREFLVFE